MSAEIMKNLGPLAAMAGSWTGDQGLDEAPAKDLSVMQTKFREKMHFEPLGPVDNHSQQLWGLRYNTTAWRLGEDDPFHEELGYWLWDPAAKMVMRCFMVPRGVTIIAGGSVEPSAKDFSLQATQGSATFGICSNPFLDQKFKTAKYLLDVKVSDGTLSYSEDTQMEVKGVSDIFHHKDSNTLQRA